MERIFRGFDPSLFGLTRMLFGGLMTIDCFVERGLQYADTKWSDSGCKFPLFNGLEQLETKLMVMLMFVQAFGALFIFLGYRVKLTGWLFVLPYWYMFILDKTRWNNHSYLFGLCGLLFTLTDSDKSFALSATNTEIPAWNYYILRLQIFILYFYAGIKKTEMDWLLGYSMDNINKHWVFDPFRSMGLSNDFISTYVVHLSGFLLDFTVGPLLLFDKTRPLGIFALTGFHLMNSRMFSIGMFSYVCLGTMWIFCRPDSPKKLVTRCPNFIQKRITTAPATKGTFKCNLRFIFFVLYAAIQLFLPYSHFITKGYNGWTQGAYGYSWDMMIHSFRQQHVKITYVDGETGELGYLKPDAFVGRAKSRWTMHPDMLKQYATCIAKNLMENNVKDPKIYFDVWKSMNSRFVQRVYDPRVDVAHYDWHPLETPEYVMPLLSHLGDWRERLKELKKEIEDQNIDVTFVADYPGLTLENYLAPDLDNTTVELMGGEVFVTLDDQDGKKVPLAIGEKYHLPPGEFHTIHAVGEEPVMYMYIYQNSTEIAIKKQYAAIMEIDSYHANGKELPENLTDLFTPEEDARLRDYFFKSTREDQLVKQNDKVRAFKKSWHGMSLYWMDKKVTNVRRGVLVVHYAISDLITGQDIEKAELEEYYERQHTLDSWQSPFFRMIKDKIDALTKDITANVKTEL